MEKRLYQRINTTIDAIIIIDKLEIEATINNISEEGVEFIINKKHLEKIQINKIIEFYFVDVFLNKNEVVLSAAQILRIKQNKKDKNYYFVGCKIKEDNNRGFYNYVTNVKTQKFVEKISKHYEY